MDYELDIQSQIRHLAEDVLDDLLLDTIKDIICEYGDPDQVEKLKKLEAEEK